MGCCVSSNNDKLPPTISNSSQQSEEETVKEVLSETPTTIQKPNLYNTTENSLKKSSLPISKYSINMAQKHIMKKPITTNNFNHPDDEVSEISDATVTTEKQYAPEDDVTEFQKRSPAKYRNQRSVGNSPARRSDPSPGRVRSGPGRRDNGECSGRRSRSPAMRVENGGYGSGLGRSPSGRKTGKSPGRVRSEMGDRIRMMDHERDYGNGGENKKWSPPTNGNESLENPLVSLECFIFL
ncbi:uncharacterized protein LOC132045768 [Lycium ferocissimum]|uniref:uncharacterized protein LOC132045768 n=1 Tax=Lycium ferocissimum TaxID=112874 RepID=UPI002815903E|nr:uncharacterized protein LOC132045768 [Lycium ferocissimum]